MALILTVVAGVVGGLSGSMMSKMYFDLHDYREGWGRMSWWERAATVIVVVAIVVVLWRLLGVI